MDVARDKSLAEGRQCSHDAVWVLMRRGHRSQLVRVLEHLTRSFFGGVLSEYYEGGMSQNTHPQLSVYDTTSSPA
jgi:hypothetical protein